ncbi:G5 domain-containing protein [Ligilactobacillus animalis]
MDKKKHTTRSEVVRVEVKYVPSAKTGKELPISIELTSNSNYELPSSIKVNGTSVALTGDGYYYSKNVKVRPNEESLIEFTVNVSGRLNKVTSFNIYIATANQGYGQPFPAKHQGQAFINNALVATNKFDSKAYNDVIQELEAPADKVEQVEVPYETVYKADPELLGGQRQVEKKGVSGQKTVITTHVLGANNQFVAKTSEEITKQPEAEIVRVGTKAETTTEAIPFVTVYEEDPTMKVTDKEVIAVAGVAGQKVTTKTYTLNEQTGDLTTQETVKVTDPVNQVIKHGPSGEINYQTEYRENKNLTAGETKVIQAGKKGASTKVYDPVNSTATATFSPKTEASVTREPQLIVVLVENSGVVDMYLSTDVSKLAPLWDKMEDGDKLLWISALRIPEKFDDAKASYSVKGQDTAIKPLESIGTITADQIPARFNISDEDLKNAEIRLETDLFTENENSLINNKALVNLLNKAGSRVISIRNTCQNKQEFKKFGFAEKAFQKAKMPYKLDDQAGLLSVTPNLIPTIVYKPLTIAIADPSGELQITSAQLKVGSEVKDLKVAAGKVQDEYTPKDDTPIEVSYAFAGKATQTRAIEFNVTADGTSVAKLSTNVQPKAHFEVTTPTNEIIEVGTKPTSTSEEIPFETIYVTDEKMRADAREVVLVEGKVGQKVTTINYTLDLNTGKVTAQPPQEVITAKPITHQIKRGVGKETSLPYTTIYQASEKLDLNKQEIKVKGKNGVLQPNGVVTRAAVTEIILVGTKPTVEEKTLDFTTLYTADPMSLPTDPEVIEQVGKAGKQVTTTKYKVDRKTGAVTALEPTVETTPAVDQIVKRGTGKTTVVAKPTKYVANVELANKTTREVVAGVDGVVHPNGKVLTEVVARVIEVGTKPVVVETAIEPQVIYQDDPTMKKDDPEVIVIPGTAGKTIETTTFAVNEQTGELSSSVATEMIKAIDRVIKRGSGEETQIPYQTRYEADATKTNGEKAVKVAGQVGIKHPNGTTTKEPVTELILVGTKPVVVETAIEPQVIYQDDPTMKKDDPEVIVIPGTAGKTIETTTFAVNEQTGELSSSVATETIAAIDRVIKRGSGEETQIPYQTRYKCDESLAKGERVVAIPGQVGIKHPNGTVTKEPVTEIILVGTKPEVVVEELDFTILCEADPTLPVGTTVIVQAGEKGQKIKTITYRVDEETGELIAEETEEVIAPVTQLVKQGTKVEEPQPEVKPVAKVETPKAQPKVELPQTGDVNENNLSLLGLLGFTGAGLLAVGRRKRQIK